MPQRNTAARITSLPAQTSPHSRKCPMPCIPKVLYKFPRLNRISNLQISRLWFLISTPVLLIAYNAHNGYCIHPLFICSSTEGAGFSLFFLYENRSFSCCTTFRTFSVFSFLFRQKTLKRLKYQWQSFPTRYPLSML